MVVVVTPSIVIETSLTTVLDEDELLPAPPLLELASDDPDWDDEPVDCDVVDVVWDDESGVVCEARGLIVMASSVEEESMWPRLSRLACFFNGNGAPDWRSKLFPIMSTWRVSTQRPEAPAVQHVTSITVRAFDRRQNIRTFKRSSQDRTCAI